MPNIYQLIILLFVVISEAARNFLTFENLAFLQPNLNIESILQTICPTSSFCLNNFNKQNQQKIDEGATGKILKLGNSQVLKESIAKNEIQVYEILNEYNFGKLAQLAQAKYFVHHFECCNEKIKTQEGIIYKFYSSMAHFDLKNLNHFMRNRENQNLVFSPQWKHSIIHDLIEASISFKNERLVHRDLKPQNVLMINPFHVVLCDFSLLTKLENNEIKDEDFRGTIGYMPPEYLSEKVIHTSFDIYSLGIIIFQIMNALTAQLNLTTAYNQIIQFCDNVDESPFVLINWEKIFYCRNIHLLVANMIHIDRYQRPTIEQIKQFFSDKSTAFGEFYRFISEMKKDIQLIETRPIFCDQENDHLEFCTKSYLQI